MKRDTTYFVAGTAASVVALLFVLSMMNYWQSSYRVTGMTIADDIEKLARIFDRINTSCAIVSFDFQKNPIDFLTVGSFASSEVGSMNLTYPDKWEGPYLEDNLEVQGTLYMVVGTKQGYFITPGEGVELPNGKIIGTDIVLDENADIAHMLHTNGLLSYKGRPLGAGIATHAYAALDPHMMAVD